MHEIKNSFNPHINSKLFNYSKDESIVKNISESLIHNKNNSFNQEEILRNKLFKKNLGVVKKGEVKIQMMPNKGITNKKSGNKFVMYKRPENGIMPKTYNGVIYADNGPKVVNTSMSKGAFGKSSIHVSKKKYDKIAATQSKKNKHKRSATPSLTVPQRTLSQKLR